jgi:hypothetical protein
MFDLPHVASRVFGTPLMIARGKLEVILGVLAPRLAGSPLDLVDMNATRSFGQPLRRRCAFTSRKIRAIGRMPWCRKVQLVEIRLAELMCLNVCE